MFIWFVRIDAPAEAEEAAAFRVTPSQRNPPSARLPAGLSEPPRASHLYASSATVDRSPNEPQAAAKAEAITTPKQVLKRRCMTGHPADDALQRIRLQDFSAKVVRRPLKQP